MENSSNSDKQILRKQTNWETAAGLGRRKTQNEIIEAQAHEIETLKRRIAQLEAELKRTKQ